jgi:hypothetical protein
VSVTDAPRPSARIDLREGFEDDDVIVRIDGEEVYRSSGVTTLPQIGRADGIDVPVGDGPVTVEVDLPRRGISGSFSVEAAGMHIGISVSGGDIGHEVSPTPFRYA